MSIANFNVAIHIANEIVTGETTYIGVRTYENSGGFVIGNFYVTLFSCILIFIAYLKRFKPAAHKRAVFGASFLLLTPAFDNMDYQKFFN